MSADRPRYRAVTPRGVIAVFARPRLWFDAMRGAWRLARRAWWRRWPPIPMPDPGYLAWREETAYGSEPDPDPRRRAADLVSYLEFCHDHRRA